MITCTNCGRGIPDTAALCPNCGTPISTPIPERPSYMPPQQSYIPPPQSQPGYMPPPQPAPNYMPPPQQGYMTPPPQQSYYSSQQYVPPMYQQGPAVNVTVVNNTSTKNNTPVIVEVILSIFGIYGVGWLMAGETTIGLILLACSILIYWPVMVVMAIFTIGLCDFPVAIAAIVVNAIVLNGALKRKATQITALYTR